MIAVDSVTEPWMKMVTRGYVGTFPSVYSEVWFIDEKIIYIWSLIAILEHFYSSILVWPVDNKNCIDMVTHDSIG